MNKGLVNDSLIHANIVFRHLQLLNISFYKTYVSYSSTYLLLQGLVSLNFMQEKKEVDFRYGLVRIRENVESIAFYRGEGNEMQLLLQRFKEAFDNLAVS